MRPAHLQRQVAEIERADNSFLNLHYALSEFLLYATRQKRLTIEFQCQGETDATEHVEPHTSSHEGALKDIVYTTMSRWVARGSREIRYDEPALLLHKKMFDVMGRDKQGISKKIEFAEWCRRVHHHAQRTSTIINANSRIDELIQSLAGDMLSNDLTRKQRENDVYQPCFNEVTHQLSVTSKQRSWINAMLRKNLGDAKVAKFIADRGIPFLLESSVTSKPVDMLDAFVILDEFMTWYACLLQTILEQKSAAAEMKCEQRLEHSGQKKRNDSGAGQMPRAQRRRRRQS